MISSLALRFLAGGVGASAGSAIPCAASYCRPISIACAAVAAAGMSATLTARATSIYNRRGDCQRRYASSKPPADGNATARRDGLSTSSSASSKTKNAQAEKGSGVNSPAATGKQVQGRRRGRKSNTAAANASNGKIRLEKYNLPSVPSTQHVHPNDIHVASFFSIHRPISVTSSIPQCTNPDIFNTIFTKRPRDNYHRHSSSNVISTLNSAVQHLETAMPDSNGKIHLDSETITLDGDSHELQGQLHHFYKPYSLPAPPVPRNTAADAEDSAGKDDMAAIEAVDPVSRSYSSVLTIRESKHEDGHTTYEAHTTPFVQIEEKDTPSRHNNEQIEIMDDPLVDGSTVGITENSTTPSRFLERMRERQMRFDAHRQSMSDMFAISVQRQRKLKMKKHKHKKLLRRTRNLRRKMKKA
ncbi:hypothetical protein KEM54_005587 [Ascosphaera aggregata]|nr:hypothetical protein KEM54_005587 [Ascosphaera aggregata]